MATPEEFPFEATDGALVVRVNGPLTMQNTSELRALALDQLASQGPLRGLIVDLSACDYVDSTAIGAFIVLKMRLRDAQRFRLCGATKMVDKIFQTTRFDQVVSIDARLADSLAALPADAQA
ncbi:MAG: STAS domain-containing protein [Spirochaetes bacterium]|nr:STAS domain-containing protein [Spirochaetota bacterium]